MVYHKSSCRLAERAESIWDDLALQVREAVRRIQVRDLLRDMVHAAQESWASMFHSAWHVDAVWGANAAIEEELNRYPEMSERFARKEGCGSLLREVDHLLGEIQSEIEEHLAEDQVAVLRLAALVYEGVYPRDVYRHMLALGREARPGADDPADGEHTGEDEPSMESGQRRAGFAGRHDGQPFAGSPTWEISGDISVTSATNIRAWHLPSDTVEPASTMPATTVPTDGRSSVPFVPPDSPTYNGG